jgi:hypothetical protein
MKEPEFFLQYEDKDKELKLETRISTKKENGRRDFIARVIFYRKGKITSMGELDSVEFQELMERYESSISGADYDRFFQHGKFGFLDRIKNISYGLDIVASSLNVIMLGNNETPVARTTVELDSDIITILKSDMDTNDIGRCMKIQGINVLFVNTVFREQFSKLPGLFKEKISQTRKIFAVTGAVLSIADLYPTLSHLADMQTNYTPLVSELIVTQQVALPLFVFFVTRNWKKLFMGVIRILINAK